jgi:YHS domain-containing protein
MKTMNLLVAALMVGVGGLMALAEGAPAEGASGAKAPQCLVMEAPIDFSVNVSTDDGPVYFCCKRCVRKYQKDPSQFSELASKQREAVAKLPKTQVMCPLSGEPVDEKSFAMVDGEKVFTCCDRCADSLKEDPKKYEAKIAASYTYQTKCPVSGEPIDPASSLAVGDDGAKVYFCCGKCAGRFEEDPKTFTDSLKSQGYATLARMAVRK